MKKLIKKIIKKILNASEKETVSDAFNKKKYEILKKNNRFNFNTEDIKLVLESLGLCKGDTVIVQCAWRAFIGYSDTPKDLIDCIRNIIGEEGTVLMPAFTNNQSLFKYDDPTNAGYLAEYFRKNYDVERSLNSIFSMCAIGKKKKEFIESHVESLYAFDKKSPYYKAIKSGTKILLLGLGKNPHKITLFHCITYELRNKIDCYKNVYSLKKNVILYNSKKEKIVKCIVDRQPKYQNNKRKFRKLFKKVIQKNNYKKINYLDIYLFDGKKVYENAKKYIIRNNYNLYK